MKILNTMLNYNYINLKILQLSRICSDRSFLIHVAFLNLVILIGIMPMLGVNKSSFKNNDRISTLDLPNTCSKSSGAHSGLELIHPQPGFREPFEVLCDQSYENGGWIVIQRRYQGSVLFYRGWQDYERGFGNLNGEFWLGLQKIHELTYSNRYELHVLLEDWDGTRAAARYGYFLVAGPEEKYKLNNLGTYSGDAGDSLDYSLNAEFSTFDVDNDDHYSNCAQDRMGAWWFKGCSYGNLNGVHMNGSSTKSMYWTTFRDDGHGLRGSQMLIRVVN